MSQTRFGLPCLYLAIFLLALTGLFAKLIPLDAISIIQLRGIVAAIGLALYSLLRKRNIKATGNPYLCWGLCIGPPAWRALGDLLSRHASLLGSGWHVGPFQLPNDYHTVGTTIH